MTTPTTKKAATLSIHHDIAGSLEQARINHISRTRKNISRVDFADLVIAAGLKTLQRKKKGKPY